MIGIYLMGFVILVSGVGALGMAIAYAIKPTESRLALMRPLSLASIFAALCSWAAGLATVLSGLAASGRGPIDWAAVSAGLAECMVPVFVAFGFLAVAWLLVAAGLRRQV
jgi:hypothetical protein